MVCAIYATRGAFINDPAITGDGSRLIFQETATASASPELLARGRERYDIFCTPCHGGAGHGDGLIVQRGYPRPPAFVEARLRAAPARYFYEVISNGKGTMLPYAAQVPPADRWAIVAYLRALQLSQGATLASLPAEDQAAVAAAGQTSPGGK